jgi:ABC-type transport system substrate-binding protein
LANTTGTIGFVYEFLYAFDPQSGELTPWLAESGTWVDDTTFDVTLRSGLKWTDGEPLTAEDVAFTFNLGKQYAALWFSPMWDYVESVTALSDKEVEFKLTSEPLYQEFENNLYNVPLFLNISGKVNQKRTSRLVQMRTRLAPVHTNIWQIVKIVIFGFAMKNGGVMMSLVHPPRNTLLIFAPPAIMLH